MSYVSVEQLKEALDAKVRHRRMLEQIKDRRQRAIEQIDDQISKLKHEESLLQEEIRQKL